MILTVLTLSFYEKIKNFRLSIHVQEQVFKKTLYFTCDLLDKIHKAIRPTKTLAGNNR